MEKEYKNMVCKYYSLSKRTKVTFKEDYKSFYIRFGDMHMELKSSPDLLRELKLKELGI